MHDEPPIDPAAVLGPAYYELALALLDAPASVDAAALTALPSLLACAPNAAQAAIQRQLSVTELQARLDRLTAAERVALLFAAERRHSANLHQIGQDCSRR